MSNPHHSDTGKKLLISLSHTSLSLNRLLTQRLSFNAKAAKEVYIKLNSNI